MPRSLLTDLRTRFTRRLADPADYERRALAECSPFPEGDLFPFTQPIVGFASAVARGDVGPDEAVRLCAPLAESAIRAVERRVHPPRGGLAELGHYAGQGVYLGQLAMALGFFRLGFGDERHELLRAHLVALLHDAFRRMDGGPIESFPGAIWPFDSVPPLVALWLDDRLRRQEVHAQVVAAHHAWVRGPGTDPDTGLPRSQLPPHWSGAKPPRGCELGWRIPLLALIDRPFALETYRRFCRTHWLERVVMAGFAEYPHGQNLGEDADSGPIALGIGLAATGFGIAAAHAAGDDGRLRRLLMQLPLANPAARLAGPFVRRHIRLDPHWVTGFLMGDVSLFGTLDIRVPDQARQAGPAR